MRRRRDNSYGIIPLRRGQQGWEVFIIQQHKGHWGFPKGHGEEDEEPRAAAERELQEETGLSVERYLLAQPLHEEFSFTHKGLIIDKRVDYFIALVTGVVTLQEAEIKDGCWLPLVAGSQRLTFEQARSLLKQTQELIMDLEGLP